MKDSPACEPEIKWTNVLDVSNYGSIPQRPTYRVTTGVTKQSGSKKLTSHSKTNGKEIGSGAEVEASVDIFKIKAMFHAKFSKAITSAEDKELSNLDIYQNEHSYEKQIDIPPRQRISVFQKIGVCGNIQVKTGKFQFNQTAL